MVTMVTYDGTYDGYDYHSMFMLTIFLIKLCWIMVSVFDLFMYFNTLQASLAKFKVYF